MNPTSVRTGHVDIPFTMYYYQTFQSLSPFKTSVHLNIKRDPSNRAISLRTRSCLCCKHRGHIAQVCTQNYPMSLKVNNLNILARQGDIVLRGTPGLVSSRRSGKSQVFHCAAVQNMRLPYTVVHWGNTAFYVTQPINKIVILLGLYLT